MEGKTMETRKGRMKSVALWGMVGFLLVAVCLLVSAPSAQAETVKFKLTSYVAQTEAIPVGDVEGHIVGVFSRKGLVLFENGEVATFTNWGTLDLIKGKGPYQGYYLLTYEDGSTAALKINGFHEPAPGGKGLFLYKITGEYTQGTGRFQGIKGTLSATGKSLTPYSKEKDSRGDVVFEGTATYTLPPKK